jgi:hypothetical protein
MYPAAGETRPAGTRWGTRAGRRSARHRGQSNCATTVPPHRAATLGAGATHAPVGARGATSHVRGHCGRTGAGGSRSARPGRDGRHGRPAVVALGRIVGACAGEPVGESPWCRLRRSASSAPARGQVANSLAPSPAPPAAPILRRRPRRGRGSSKHLRCRHPPGYRSDGR